MWSQSTNVTDRRTDRQTTCDRNTALCTKVHRAVKTVFRNFNWFTWNGGHKLVRYRIWRLTVSRDCFSQRLTARAINIASRDLWISLRSQHSDHDYDLLLRERLVSYTEVELCVKTRGRFVHHKCSRIIIQNRSRQLGIHLNGVRISYIAVQFETHILFYNILQY